MAVRPEPFYAISLVIYLAAFIATCVELNWANQWYQDTCFLYEDFETESSQNICWPFFIVAWALALPSAIIGCASSIALLSLHRKGAVSRRAAIWTNIGVAILWLVTILIGWIQPTLSDGTELPSTDFFSDGPDSGSLGYGNNDQPVSPPVTGMFVWCVDFYNDIMPYQSSGYDWVQEDSSLFNSAEAGMAAVVLTTMAFSWSIIMVIFTISNAYDTSVPKPSTQVAGQGQPQLQPQSQPQMGYQVPPTLGDGYVKPEYNA